MPVPLIKIIRPGREPLDETVRQARVQKPLHFLHHAFGHPFRREQGVAFELGGQQIAKLVAEIGFGRAAWLRRLIVSFIAT